MKNILLILFTFITTTHSFSQSKIGTFDKSEKEIYNWITFISKSDLFIPENQKKEEFPVGEFYRLIITTSEIYNGIYIEKGTESENGGGTRIIWKRIVNEDDLYDNFLLNGEFSGITFIKWNSFNSFALKIHGENYMFSEIGKKEIKVQKLKK